MVKRTFVYVLGGKLATIAIPALGEKIAPPVPAASCTPKEGARA